MIGRIVRILQSMLIPAGERERNARALFFLHIRKTAGTTLNHLLATRCHGPRCLFHAHTTSLTGKTLDQFELVEAHAGYEFLRRFSQRPVVMVMLRHPIDRAVSSYYYNRSLALKRRSGERMHVDFPERRLRMMERTADLELTEFLCAEPELADEFLGNEQTRALAGVKYCTAAPHVQAALANLENCELIGLMEEFEESAQQACRWMGWQPFQEIPKQNVTQGRPAAEELNATTRELLEQLLAPDLIVYEHARRLFTERRSTTPHPAVIPSGFPRLEDFTFDQPILGAGWHSREFDGSNWFCWTGGERTSWLEFRPPEHADSNHELRCEFFQPPPSRIAESVQLKINGKPVRHRLIHDNGKMLLSAGIPMATMGRDRSKTRVEFVVGEHWRPCDVNPSSTDTRRLGIALQRISLNRAA